MDRLPFKYKNILCFCLGVYLGYCIVFWLSKYILLQHTHHCSRLLNPSTLYQPSSLPVPHNNFLLVAVMTTRKYLKTRAEAIYRTWGQRVPGRIVFFVGGTEPYNGHLPVILLENITENTYPPQKKSFAMLEYVATHFVNDYEWFMRSDDDVFVKMDKLERFLRSVNSSKALYIGQPGTGTQEETGKLGLHNSAPYCMGGPGVFFTSRTLKRIRNHLNNCLLNAVTLHEDTEVGRCVQIYAGIACSNAFQFAHLFYQNYKNKSGSFNHQLGRAEERAITLHPIKHHPYMFRLDVYFSTSRLERLNYKVRKVSMAIQDLSEYIDGRTRRENKDHQESRSRGNQMTGHTVPDFSKNLDKRDPEISWNFVTRSKFYSLDSVNPLSDLSLKGRSISVRHSRFAVSNDPRFRNYRIRPESYHRQLNGHVQENIYLMYHTRQDKSHSVKTKQLFSKIQFNEPDISITSPTMWVILPVYRNSKMYANFLSEMARALERFKGKIILCVILFQDSQNDYKFSKHHSDIFSDFSTKLKIHVIQTTERFTETRAVTTALKIIPIDGLVLQLDVNFAFDSTFLHRVILNTKQGQQAYFPVYFNRYNPKIVCFEQKSCDKDRLSFESKSGTFRFNSYEILSIYKSDLVKVRGKRTETSGEISGISLYEKCLSKLNVIQSVDPFLFRFYQPCDKISSKDRQKTCEKSRFPLYGHDAALFSLIQTRIKHV